MKTAPELQSSTSIIIRNSFAVPFAATLMFAPSACGTSGPTSPALIADLLPSVRRIVVHEARCAPHSAGASLNAQRHGKNREHQHFSSDDAESQPRISEWLNTSNFKTDDGEPWLVGMLLADPTRIAFPAAQSRLRHRLLPSCEFWLLSCLLCSPRRPIRLPPMAHCLALRD